MAFNYFNNSSVTGKTNQGGSRRIDDIDAERQFGGQLFGFTSFTFGTANLTGRAGPTLNQLLAVYDTTTYDWLNDTANFNVDSNATGVQMFTIPETANYTIRVTGATGGFPYVTNSRVGKGAIVQAVFSFTVGDILRIVVGQKGRPISTSNPDGPGTGPAYNSGGGGGSFVFSTLTDSEPLIVAGGGGGGSYGGTSTLAPDASNLLTGVPGFYVTNNGSSRAGNALVPNQSLGYGGYNNNGVSHKAGGGAGWKGSGHGGHSICSPQSPYHVQAGWYKGKTLSTASNTTNGGPFMGGWGGNNNAGNGSQQGGFGGGGGGTGRCGSCQAGGGGGYSGGGIVAGNTNGPTKEALAGGGNYVNSSGSSGQFISYSTIGTAGSVLITKS